MAVQQAQVAMSAQGALNATVMPVAADLWTAYLEAQQAANVAWQYWQETAVSGIMDGRAYAGYYAAATASQDAYDAWRAVAYPEGPGPG
jgi:hypothetical protein